MTSSAIKVEGVSKRFRIYHERNQSVKSAIMRRGRAKYEDFWALSDIDLEIPSGGTFGLVGHNGSGKSTLLKCLARILVPDKGRVSVNGRISALLELGAGFHPELSGRDNIYLNGAILGLSKRDLDAKYDEIVQFAGLEQFIDTPVKNYSSGMYVRLGFSVAINVDPDILLVDEVLAVGDQAFQQRSAAKFQEFKDAGKTIVVVSHSLGSVRELCDRVAWLDQGRVLESGETDEIVARYAEVAGVQDDSSAAWTREAELTSVTFASGEREETIAALDPVAITIRWEATREVRDAEIRLSLRHHGGGVVADTTTAERGSMRIEPGTGAATLTVGSLTLAAGTYVLDATLVPRGGKRPVHALLDGARLHVEPRGLQGSSGFVVLGGTWRSDQ